MHPHPLTAVPAAGWSSSAHLGQYESSDFPLEASLIRVGRQLHLCLRRIPRWVPIGAYSRCVATDGSADFYTREFLTASSPSDIRYVWVQPHVSTRTEPLQLDRQPPALPHVRPGRPRRPCVRQRILVSRVSSDARNPQLSSLPRSSHHVEIGGAVLYVFSIFMLSLTQQDHYYQVSGSTPVRRRRLLNCMIVPRSFSPRQWVWASD